MQMRASDLARKWLPAAAFSEHHRAAVTGEPSQIIAALLGFDDGKDPIVRFMLQLREAPIRLWDGLGGRSGLRGRPRFGLHEFTILEQGEMHLVLGLCGRFWRPDFGLVEIRDAQDFAAFDRPGVARLVMVFTVENSLGGVAVQQLVTETHVHCPDRRSQMFFMPYWWAIRLGSGFIRRRILYQIREHMMRVSTSDRRSGINHS